MIPFFRKIRKKMADDNKPMKYLRYAIGEIVLVVIGILIALQVNNWNEDRKTQLQEIKILKEIKLDLISTRDEVQSDLNAHSTMLKNSKNLLHHLRYKLPKNDSIVYYLLSSSSDVQVYPKTSGFEALKSIGIDLIKNDSLRTQITNYYQLSVKRIVESGRKENPFGNLRTTMDSFIATYIVPENNLEKIRSFETLDGPIDIPLPKLRRYEQLINDDEFLSCLVQSILSRAGIMNSQQRMINTSNRIIQHIENELKQVES